MIDPPDAFYELNRSGRMEWRVTPSMLGLDGRTGVLRNIGVLCIPSQRRPELGRLACAYSLSVDVDAAGSVTVLDQLPPALAVNGLVLDATFPPGTNAGEVTLDFGDGSPPTDGTGLPHAYATPGAYDMLIRIAGGGRLTEYHAAVVVSVLHGVSAPLVAMAQMQAAIEATGIRLVPTVGVPSGESLGLAWRLDGRPVEVGSAPASFLVQPGRHVLQLTATRQLVARFYSQQRYDPAAQVQLDRLAASSNRTFDIATGAETTQAPNAFGQHVFAGAVLSPVDRWTLELPLDDNPGLVGVTTADTPRHELGELADVVLSLEYFTEHD